MFLPPSGSGSSPSMNAPQASSSSRRGLWLGIGAVLMVVVVIAVILLRSRTLSEDGVVVPITSPVTAQKPAQAPDNTANEVGSAPELRPDADGDGLSDEEEARLGTNARSHDTDGDGISDREEAMILKTDPKTPNPSPFVHPLDRERQQGATTPPAVNP